MNHNESSIFPKGIEDASCTDQDDGYLLGDSCGASANIRPTHADPTRFSKMNHV